jgi:hypothetical protein
LRAMETAARDTGAASVIYFALPGPGLEAAYSERDLTAGDASTHALSVRREDGRLVMTNIGPLDLPSRPADPASPSGRGWVIEILAEKAGAFDSTNPGEFVLAEIHDDLPAELATSVAFRFSRLRCGGSLTTGLILQSGAPLRWRLEALDLSGEIE